MMDAIDNKEHKMQQRIYSEVNVDAVEEKLRSRIEKIKLNFDTMEAISREFDRRNKGYKHSIYLVFVATKVLRSNIVNQRIPFLLGPGQGKSWAALLLA